MTVGNPAESPLKVGRECTLRAVGRVLLVEILGMARETIWISFPSQDPLAEGTGVELEFHNEGGYICYHARVAAGPRNTSNGIMLERSETASHMQRRREWRVPMNFSIWLRKHGEEDAHKAQMRDLSADGALIHTLASLEAGEMVDLAFQLPEYPTVRLRARAVYCDDTKAGYSRFGLRFEEMPHQTRESITWYLYDRIHALYPEQLQDLYPRPSSDRRLQRA